jgi:hypothetical protein
MTLFLFGAPLLVVATSFTLLFGTELRGAILITFILVIKQKPMHH